MHVIFIPYDDTVGNGGKNDHPRGLNCTERSQAEEVHYNLLARFAGDHFVSNLVLAPPIKRAIEAIAIAADVRSSDVVRLRELDLPSFPTRAALLEIARSAWSAVLSSVAGKGLHEDAYVVVGGPVVLLTAMGLIACGLESRRADELANLLPESPRLCDGFFFALDGGEVRHAARL